MMDPEPKKSERRQSERVPVSGTAQVYFDGQVFTFGLRDASRSGLLIELLSSDPIPLKGNDDLVVQTSDGDLSLYFVCTVRHVSKKVGSWGGRNGVCVGLEPSFADSGVDLLQLLVDSGVARKLVESGADNSLQGVSPEVLRIELIRAGLKTASATRILGPGHVTPVLRESVENPQIIDANEKIWKVAIDIISSSMKIDFKVCYSLAEARKILTLKRNCSDFEDRLCHDYMREYCNLTAGAMKAWIASHDEACISGEKLKIQLPMQVANADFENIFTGTSFEARISDRWQVVIAQNTAITCQADITILDWKALASLKSEEIIAEPASDGSEIEFF